MTQKDVERLEGKKNYFIMLILRPKLILGAKKKGLGAISRYPPASKKTDKSFSGILNSNPEFTAGPNEITLKASLSPIFGALFLEFICPPKP
jgi:hypothetical protein